MKEEQVESAEEGRVLLLTSLPSSLDDGTGVGGDTWPEVSALLCDGSSDGGSLHVTLGVDNDTGRVLKVEEDTIAPAPRLALSDDDSWHDCGREGWR